MRGAGGRGRGGRPWEYQSKCKWAAIIKMVILMAVISVIMVNNLKILTADAAPNCDYQFQSFGATI
jgi:hypothetical protein